MHVGSRRISTQMIDIVDRTTRSRMMAGIRAKDTKPEIAIRRGLHNAGFRYRLHDKTLPGRPDLVFRRYNAVVFVNGCFWHGHSCALFKWPSTRPAFWQQKIRGNVQRDTRDRERLAAKDFRVLTIWECALKGRGQLGYESVIALASDWLRSRRPSGDIFGRGVEQTGGHSIGRPRRH